MNEDQTGDADEAVELASSQIHMTRAAKCHRIKEDSVKKHGLGLRL